MNGCAVLQVNLEEEDDMGKMVGVAGNVSAIVGILLAFGAGLARVLGLYLVSGYTTMTLFQVGTGFMVLACLCKLETMQQR
jgi:hypothetical protein